MQVIDKALPAADAVRAALGRHLLTDGYDLVLDLERSRGVRLHDGVIVWAEHLGLAHGEAENLVPRPPE